jgi:hypothetical protein
MKCLRLLLAFVSLGMLVCVWIAGCGKNKLPDEGVVVLVTGKLTNGGTPLEAKPPRQTVEVIFAKDEGPGKRPNPNDVHTVQVKPDGTFTMQGRYGKGIPPGKYRVGVRQWSYTPPPSGGRMDPKVYRSAKGLDLLGGKYEENSSPIVREITDKDKTVEIDISKPEG